MTKFVFTPTELHKYESSCSLPCHTCSISPYRISIMTVFHLPLATFFLPFPLFKEL